MHSVQRAIASDRATRKKKERDLESRNLDKNILKIHTERRSKRERQGEYESSVAEFLCGSSNNLCLAVLRGEIDSPKMTKAQGKKARKCGKLFSFHPDAVVQY